MTFEISCKPETGEAFATWGSRYQAAEAIIALFDDKRATLRSVLDDLMANFADPAAQGPRAYAEQMRLDHPELDETVLRADAVIGVRIFYTLLFPA